MGDIDDRIVENRKRKCIKRRIAPETDGPAEYGRLDRSDDIFQGTELDEIADAIHDRVDVDKERDQIGVDGIQVPIKRGVQIVLMDRIIDGPRRQQGYVE